MATRRQKTGYYTSHVIARMLSVSPSTVLGWVDKGLLRAHRTPGGHRRVPADALIRFLRESGMPIPPELVPAVRLLIVDDDVVFLGATERALRRRAPELSVETASSAMDGLLRVGTLRPDAVVLDAYMPGMDGVEVCRRLMDSPETAHIRVVAVTGRPSSEISDAFAAAGAKRCLAKPVRAKELLTALGLHVG